MHVSALLHKQYYVYSWILYSGDSIKAYVYVICFFIVRCFKETYVVNCIAPF